MPKSKKTKKKTTVVTDVIRKTTHVSRKKKKPKKVKAMLPMGAKAVTNASAYAASIFDPFAFTGIRIPEVMPISSSTASLTWEFSLNLHTVSTAKFGGIYFRPMLYGCYAEMSASSTNFFTGAVWEGAFSAGGYSALVPTASMYRTVSAGIRVKDYGAYLDKGGIVYSGLVPFSPGVPIPPDGNIWEEAIESGHIQILNSQDNAQVEKVHFWYPMTTSPVADASTSSLFLTPTGSAWRSIDETYCTDNTIMWGIWGPDTMSDTIEIEFVLNVEFVPFLANRDIFSTAAVSGTPSALEAAVTSVSDAAAAKGGTVAENLKKGILEKSATALGAFGAAAGILNNLGKSGLGSGGYFDGDLIGGLSHAASTYFDTGTKAGRSLGLLPNDFTNAGQWVSTLGNWGAIAGLFGATQRHLSKLHSTRLSREDMKQAYNVHMYIFGCSQLHQTPELMRFSPFSTRVEDGMPTRSPVDISQPALDAKIASFLSSQPVLLERKQR